MASDAEVSDTSGKIQWGPGALVVDRALEVLSVEWANRTRYGRLVLPFEVFAEALSLTTVLIILGAAHLTALFLSGLANRNWPRKYRGQEDHE